MVKKFRLSVFTKAILLSVPLLSSSYLYAASSIDIAKQKENVGSFLSQNIHAQDKLFEVSRHKDINNTLHIRFYQTFNDFQVWGGDGIAHAPNADKNADLKSLYATNKNLNFNGTLYGNIKADLGSVDITNVRNQQSKITQLAINDYEQKVGGKVNANNVKSDLIVFVDKANKAHWAYHVEFYVASTKDGVMPAKPNFIIDALSKEVYEQWNNIQTLDNSAVDGGGIGGNKKMGKMIYDGTEAHLAKLIFKRDDETKSCYLQNSDVVVKHYSGQQIVKFDCAAQDPDNNNLYWDAELHAVNGGYSPDNDALFGGQVIKQMYQKWYNVPVLIENGKPMVLTMVVHARMDNAYWDGRKMTFGDGISMFYPLTSLGVAAHEISHGFTQQHSNLRYYGQSGGMNEAFSDMAAQGAEYFAYGKNSWQIGPEIFKKEGEALRYMDQPSKDCGPGRDPGDYCSIDDASEYHSGIDVHYSSGVYNRIFYLIGSNTDAGYNARKAFDVMVKANQDYWTPSSTFKQGACGIIKAATDLKYDLKPIYAALDTTKVDYSDC